MATGKHAPREMTFHERLSAAIADSGLTLETICQRLAEQGTRVSPATLSYWQSGHSVPTRARSLAAVDVLSRVLGQPDGWLRGALPGDKARAERMVDIKPASSRLASILAELDFSDCHWRGVTNTDHVTIAANRSEKSVQCEQALEATEDGLRRIAAIYYQDAEGPASPAVTALRGCRVGRMVQVPEERLVVAELVLSHFLDRGQLAHLAYRIDCEPNDVPSTRWERGLIKQVPAQVMTITFEGDGPSSASRYFMGEAIAVGSGSLPRDELPGDPIDCSGRWVQSVVPNARAGVHGIAWHW